MTGSYTRLRIIGVSTLLFLFSGAVHTQAAISDDTALIESGDANPGIYITRGQAYLSTGNFAEAETDFTRALGMTLSKEERHSLYWARGSVRMQLQNNEGAIDDFTNALEIEESAQIYHSRARVHFALEQLDNAKGDLDNALVLGLSAVAERAKAFEMRASILMHQGEYRAAIIDFSAAIEIQPAPRFYYHRANLLRTNGNPGAALSDYQKVVGDDQTPAPMASQAFLGVAFIFHGQRDVVNAMAAYDRFFAGLAGADDQTRALGAQLVQGLVKSGQYSGAARIYNAELRNALVSCVKTPTCNP